MRRILVGNSRGQYITASYRSAFCLLNRCRLIGPLRDTLPDSNHARTFAWDGLRAMLGSEWLCRAYRLVPGLLGIIPMLILEGEGFH